REDHTATLLQEPLSLQKHVRGALAFSWIRESLDAFEPCGERQVLESMRFIDVQTVDPQILERHCLAVALPLFEALLADQQPRRKPLDRLLDRFLRRPPGSVTSLAGCVDDFAHRVPVTNKLALDELRFSCRMVRQERDLGLRDNDRVPVTSRNACHELVSTSGSEIILTRYKQRCHRIEVLEFLCELL